ncbi:MAG: SDR family NAD(P)-dependent oxidoreductase [Bacteroidales bacterium]|jgi:3-oxoacyl-[acyl-carrier protein] reductase|nr:SDR family NAD(P)-dependent oxidoreductase [Bacteroidales bacterium]
MYENYIFSGIGYATGSNLITNKELEDSAKKGYLEGFSDARIKRSEGYIEFVKNHGEISPFEYFAGEVMGFKTRGHVTPFPVTPDKMTKNDTTLELAVKAAQSAFNDSGVHPEDIDLWLGSCGTPFEQAPGVASTLKTFFVGYNNQSPAATITSACVGFNIHLQRAVEYFKCHPEAKHILVFHTETLSHLLPRRTNFVNYVTFADGAAAVVLSRVEGEQKEGLMGVVNHEDLFMIDHLGADANGDLYMTPKVVKVRAIENLCKSGKEVLDKIGWEKDDIDILVPHQTGNAIVHGAAKKMEVSLDKVFQDVQLYCGNISGASIPAALAKLKRAGRLTKGIKTLSPTAGLGGEYGCFAYQWPEQSSDNKLDISADLVGKVAVVTGASGGIGYETAKSLANRGCNLALQYTSNTEKAEELKNELSASGVNIDLFKVDFSDLKQAEQFADDIIAKYGTVDFLIHSAAITGGLYRGGEVPQDVMLKVAMVNQFSPVTLTKRLKDHITDTILYVGSVAEDAQFSGSSSYVQAKRGLHGFASSFSGEAKSAGIRSVYYMPGVVSGGMAGTLNDEQINAAIMAIGQRNTVSTHEIAERITKSLYLPKVLGVFDDLENAMLVRRDSYSWEEQL